MTCLKEKWKDVIGYEGCYKISNLGNIKSITRYVKKIDAKRLSRKRGVYLKTYIDRFGYIQVCLSINGKRSSKSIHRIVASSFIPNPKGKPQVNHINGIKDDNRVDNLEWVTASENMRHAYDVLKRKPNRGIRREEAEQKLKELGD